MSTARRAIRNIFSLMVSRPLSKVVAFFVSVWLVRYLGTEELGMLATALGFVALFGYVSDFGTQHFVMREVSRDRSTAGAYLSNFLSLQMVFGVFLFAVIVLVVNSVGHYSRLVKEAIYLAGAGLVVTSMSAPFKAAFYAHEAIHISALFSVLLALAGAVLTAGGILLGRGIRFFAAISIVSGLVIAIVSYRVCRKRLVRPRLGKDFRLWWRMLKMSLPFALLMGATILYRKIDIQMLYAMKGKIAVGYYSAVTRLINPLMMQIQAITVAMLPVMSRQFVGKGEKFRFTAEKTLKYVAALGIPLAIGAFLLSDKIVLLLYGNEFRSSIPALQILSWTLAISALTSVISCCAIASGRVVMLAAFNAVAVLGNVAANLLLIPRYSFRGAAAATLGCEVVLLAVFVSAVWRSEVARFPFRDIGKVLVAALTMGGFVFLCRSASFFIVVPAGAAIYCGVLLLLRFVAKEEKDLLRSALRRA